MAFSEDITSATQDMESLKWSEYEISSRRNLVDKSDRRCDTDPPRRCVHRIFIVYSTLAAVSAGILGLSQFLVSYLITLYAGNIACYISFLVLFIATQTQFFIPNYHMDER